MSRPYALVFALLAGCSGVHNCPDGYIPPAAVALDPCEVSADCAPYLNPGPCGILACDPTGLLGEPAVPDVPSGCYIRITPKCETPPNIGGPCSATSDCIQIKCYSVTCVEGLCSAPTEPAGTVCDPGMACDGAGRCVAAP